MENKALDKLYGGQIRIGDSKFNPIKVNISQFYGIEINDFAVTVAKTALWIAESQMMHKTEEILHLNLEFLPLKSYTNIIEANALRIDWNDVIDKTELNYIMGNPPFVGYLYQSSEQKKDIRAIFPKNKKAGNLDYVACWYEKASEMMNGTKIESALVSTNSITQGESVGILWNQLFLENLNITFAHRTFRWDSEASVKAHVHCVIIGFSKQSTDRSKYIYENGKKIKANNINGYLMDAPNIAVLKRREPLCDVPKMAKGSQLIDGGNFTVGDEIEYQKVIEKEPDIKDYIKKYYNAQIFLNNGKTMYVLDLNRCDPNIIRNSKYLMGKVESVKKYRDETSDFSRELSNQPSKYYQYVSPMNNSIIIPQASSERRRYIPMGFAANNVIYTNQLLFIDNADLYHFGILESNVHMAWMRAVAGRLKSDYRYSKDIVYNNFPWVTCTGEQKERIKKTAQAILDARAKYPSSSLADLYDELTMPVELRKAHQQNDIAVMEAYGFDWRHMTESDCVAELMKMYQKLVESTN